jgi:L(+)-tartrate dehydratase beta subunit
MERFSRPLIAQCGVRLIIGKGAAESLVAFAEVRAPTWRSPGGTAALETT